MSAYTLDTFAGGPQKRMLQRIMRSWCRCTSAGRRTRAPNRGHERIAVFRMWHNWPLSSPANLSAVARSVRPFGSRHILNLTEFQELQEARNRIELLEKQMKQKNESGSLFALMIWRSPLLRTSLAPSVQAREALLALWHCPCFLRQNHRVDIKIVRRLQQTGPATQKAEDSSACDRKLPSVISR